MNYEDKTKEQLVNELIELHQRITNLKISEELHERFKDALATSERRFRELAVLLPETVFEIDLNAKFTFVNRVAFDIFGYAQEDFDRGINAFQVIAQEDHERLKENISRLYNGEDIGIIEFTAQKKDGSRFPVIIHSNVIKNEDGAPIGYRGILIDITVRKRAEEAFKTSEVRYRGLYESSRDGIISVDMDGNVTECNQSLADILGYTKEELYRSKFQNLMPNKWLAKTAQILNEQIIPQGFSDVYEIEAIKKDGTIIPISARSWLIKDKDGNLVGTWAIIRDITKRKRVEEAFKESEERYRSLFEDSRDALYFTTREGKLINFNQATIELFGFSREELLKLNVQDLYIDPTDRSKFQHEIEQKGSVRDYELKLRKKDRTRINCLFTATVRRDKDGNIEGYQGTIRDITERKKLERQLIESEEKYRTLVEKDPNMIYLVKDGKVAFANQALLNTLGYSLKEIYAMNLDDVSAIVPDQRQMIKERLQKRIAGENVPESYEFSLMTKKGEIIPCLLNTTSFELEGSRIIQGVLTDIRKIKELETELKESEERYRGLYESSIDGIVSADRGNIIECNQAFADMLGYTKEEIKKMRYTDLVPSKWHDELRQLLIEPVQKKGYSDEYKIEIVKKDGTVIPISISAWTMKDNEGIETKGWAIIRDISEKRKTEEELHKIEKLESLGILAGGIAHDFNNILTGILGNITLAKMYAPFREKVLERLTEAEKATMRARDLTQQLLTFSRGGSPVKKTASIDELLRDTTVFTLSGSNVKCRFSIPEDIWSVEIDEGQISQVINNLIINADQAMPEGGIISISAENVIIETKDVLPLQEGSYVKLSIKDQGIGIPEEYLQKIFDPYFTTKQKGSGLGLTIAYSIIKNHKGHIAVESKLGAGSSFSIYLPALKTQVPKKKEAEKRPITGKGKIMVMDDEEVIRDSLGEILTFLGYEVGFARNGEEAIAIFKRAKDTGQAFDAVILDLTIRGGMGGKEAIKKLLEIDSNVKAIVSSGYSTDPVMADYQNYGFSGVVAKPYDIKELSEALDNVINGI